MPHQTLLWICFNVFVFVMLVVDLFFHRKDSEIKVKEAMLWSAFWIALALVFNLGVYYYRGHDAALKFLTGYLLEESLSVDNLFVFLIIFSYFKIPHRYQHKILFWGILGAVCFRALFIFAGVALIHRFHWIIYFFGALLVWTGYKLFSEKDKEVDPDKNVGIRLFKKVMPVTTTYEHGDFFVKKDKKWYATPLWVALIAVETTDIIFAVDSIPAILAVTTDPFIVYTSNIFAILGLRSLFFALSGMMQMFHFLHYGLGAILIFVGVKMLIADIVKVPIAAALAVIAGVLALSVIASIIWPQKKEKK